ncbi:MFS transporter [Acidisphaera sp. S103]|uniref:MFS transporter n=1 Tax=Acidisphaera sp. S103 TaxID=1747223 RepID=UPI00131A9A1B|nr:MFS transporter [Acidisphaera sp. S103]
MSGYNRTEDNVPWWKEPTKDQWYAYCAAWMGWTLDAFDFTVFLLIMAPIAAEFHVPLLDVTAIFSVTLIMRLSGATASGWLADRLGRRAPLMISILWYSVCNFAAGLSPSFTFLFLARAILGIGMGAEWPAGAALAMESWPARSRGLMSGVLQGSWGLGFALSGLAYGFLYAPLEAWHKGYGWRGMLILGVLPALACVWIRYYVKEPEVWTENKKIQDASKAQVTLPLFAIFKRKYLFNTLTGCVWMGANFCVYYAMWAMLGTYLQKELGWTPAQVAVPVFWGNILTFAACSFWGALSERIGRRWALMIPCSIAIVLVPLYLSTTDPNWFLGLFLLTICFVAGKDALNPGWLSERFPTEVRATAAGFVYHQGAVWGAAVAPTLTYFAVNRQMGFAMPMLYATVGSLIVYVIAVYLGPETKGKVMTAELEVIEVGVSV